MISFAGNVALAVPGPSPMMSDAAETPHERAQSVASGSVLSRAMEPVGHAAKLFADLRNRSVVAVLANRWGVFQRLGPQAPPPDEIERFGTLLKIIDQTCLEYGMTYTSDMAKRIIDKPAPTTYAEIFPDLDHLNGSLSYELRKEAVFRISYERKDYYERDNLFGLEVADAFPSCARDIQNAGNCYALGQADACVHHLMLVLERGLNALAES